MYFYDWSWQLLKEPSLPIREIMYVCDSEIVYKKPISKLCIFPMRIFFLTNKLEKIMQNNWNVDKS